MVTVVLVIHLLLAIAMVGVILLQRSEGGALGMGGGGGGASGGLVSARAAGNVLTRTTAILAVCFMSTSMLLAILANVERGGSSVLDGATPAAVEAPAAPAEPEKPAEPTGPAVPLSQ